MAPASSGGREMRRDNALAALVVFIVGSLSLAGFSRRAKVMGSHLRRISIAFSFTDPKCVRTPSIIRLLVTADRSCRKNLAPDVDRGLGSKRRRLWGMTCWKSKATAI
jgi:hypothetical protein